MVRRLVQLAVVLVLVTVFTALLTSLLPGDPVEVIAPFAEEAQREQLRNELGLDRPLPARYLDWLGGLVTGDLGNYYTVTGTDPVADRVVKALPVSLLLMLYAQMLALAVAIPFGVLTAHRAGSLLDNGANSVAFAAIAVPNFALGLLLSYYVGVKLGWLPFQGYTPLGDDPVEHFRRMALPAFTLAVGQIAIYLRLLRSDMIATLQEDYITMAVSKGLSPRYVLFRHALRPSSLTMLTVAGLNVGSLVGGALVIELIFGLPGLGREIAQAILARQYIALQSMVALVAVGYVVVNVAIDLLYVVLDPRIRHARA
ncbi:MAG: ABC transporter permease [Acidimicrobiales bacterium]